MNTVLLTIILVPIVEIYLFIKIGSQIGAFNTISLIFITAITEVFYARYEGLAYEIVSGASIAFASLLLIIPGFATDLIGFLLILPLTRKIILGKFTKKFKNKSTQKKTYIDGEYEDLEDDNDRKL